MHPVNRMPEPRGMDNIQDTEREENIGTNETSNYLRFYIQCVFNSLYIFRVNKFITNCVFITDILCIAITLIECVYNY